MVRNRIYTKSRVERHVIKHRCIASEKMIIEITKDGLDIKNIISVQLTGGVGNSTVGYEYGRVHSYRACKVHHDPVMTPLVHYLNVRTVQR